MSIEALVDPAPAVLRAACARPDVASAMDEAHAALAELRAWQAEQEDKP